MNTHFSSARLPRALLLHLAMIPLGLLSGMNSLRADPPEAQTATHSLALGAGFETGRFGQALLGELGVGTLGLHTLDGRKYVLQWDASTATQGGYVGNEHPGMVYLGGRLGLAGEAGVRLVPSSPWSPYVGFGATVAGSAVGLPSTPPSGYTKINNLDGVVGTNGMIAARISAGASYLGNGFIFTPTVFAQEAVRAPAALDRAQVFHEIGVKGILDLPKNLRVVLEGTVGKTGQQTDAVFGSTNQTTRAQASLGVTKFLGRTFFLDAKGSLVLVSNETSYSGSAIKYNSAEQAVPVVMIAAGVALP